MACDLCNGLNGSLSKNSPHSKLDTSFSTRYYGGVAKRKIELYQCTECGVVLSRDMDESDPHANWSITHKIAAN
jgi:hypothetical protein